MQASKKKDLPQTESPERKIEKELKPPSKDSS